jgi:glyoxylate reductase
MMKPMKIYMPTPFPSPLGQDWGEGFELDIDRSGFQPSREKMKRHLTGAVGVVLNLDDIFDREMIDAAPYLQVITLFAGSTYNIDVEYAKQRGITLITAQGEIFENTADLTFALLMAAARRIPEADAYIRAGQYTQWHPDLFLGGDIYGKTLGILGLGVIGAAVARRAAGFGMEILYSNTQGPRPELERTLGCTWVETDVLIRRSDFISLHCKLTPDTRHIIGPAQLAAMKREAYLINTGRGALVDEAALADALEQGLIAGAGLDVFEFEPVVTEKLKNLPNVVMTPHLGASSRDNRLAMAHAAKKATMAALIRAEDFMRSKTPRGG